MNVSGSEVLALVQSFVFSALILLPVMFLLKAICKKYVPEGMQLNNLPDSMVRTIALTVFLILLGSVGIVLFNWNNWYGFLGPIVTILLFIFIPFYKKMQ